MAGGFVKLAFSFPSDTEVYNSCSLLFNDKMYIFGGYNEMRQISEIKDCGLKRIGNLEFDFDGGACTVIQSSTLILCFDWYRHGGKVCRVANSPTASFKKIPESNFYHYISKIASNGGKSILSFFCNQLTLRNCNGNGK